MAITYEVGRILDVGRAFELQLPSFDEQASITHSNFNAQIVLEHSIQPLTLEQAGELARKENRHRAEFGIDRIQDAVVVASVYDCDVEHNIASAPGETVHPLNFENAVYRSDSVAPGYRIHEVTIQGLQRHGSGNYWVLDRKEDAAKRWLASMSIEGRSMHLQYDVQPPVDQDLMRWMRYLGPAYDRLGYTLAGVHKNEDELDERLSRIAALFEGTDREKEVWDVLLEIRTRAIARKTANEMAEALGTNIPTVAYLDETIDFLRSVD